MAEVLVFSNMTQMTEMKANYKKLDEVVIDIRRTELGEFLKFDNLGRYKFFKCEECAGLILSHLTVKYRGLEGECYDSQTVKSFEEWLEGIAEFRQAVENREKKERTDRQKFKLIS